MENVYYFDETIFTTAETFIPFNRVNVYNRADEYLATRSRLQINSDSECEPRKNQTRTIVLPIGNAISESTADEKSKLANAIVNLNPRKPCRGINMYTFNITNTRIEKTINFNQITVADSENHTPIFIGEHIPESIYTVGDLTNFESAIMVKYFAINHANVCISRHLYTSIVKYFDTKREWFNYLPIGVIQKKNKELVYQNRIINVPDIKISDVYMPLY